MDTISNTSSLPIPPKRVRVVVCERGGEEKVECVGDEACLRGQRCTISAAIVYDQRTMSTVARFDRSAAIMLHARQHCYPDDGFYSQQHDRNIIIGSTPSKLGAPFQQHGEKVLPIVLQFEIQTCDSVKQ